MSTKAIDEVLRAVRLGLMPDRDVVHMATRELAALFAAAKHISEGEGDEALRKCGEDYDAERSLFDSIAEEGT